jgi:molecular chaperone GrpE
MQKKIINKLAIVNKLLINTSITINYKDMIFPPVKPQPAIVNNRAQRAQRDKLIKTSIIELTHAITTHYVPPFTQLTYYPINRLTNCRIIYLSICRTAAPTARHFVPFLVLAKLLQLPLRMIFKKKHKMTDKATEQDVNNTTGAENTAAEAEMMNENSGEAANEATEEILEEVDELQKLQDEIDELKDKNLRLVAEFDNFRKRTAKERIELISTAGKDIVQSLLDVVDDSNRALKQMEVDNAPASLKEGATLVFNKLQHILQQKGLKPMDCMGKDFDADLHEAITEIPAPAEDMKGKILDVVQPGYYLNDKLIRHAKVVVGA